MKTPCTGFLTWSNSRAIEEWGEILGDEVMTGALIDCLMHHCHSANGCGNSYGIREHTDL
jgi:DNA replication protein DnaC